MLILALSFLSACQPPPYTAPDTGTPGDTGSGSTDPGVTIEITFPANETVAVGCQMFVVDYTGLRLVDPMESPVAVEGEGHYHILHSETYALCAAPYCLVGFTEEEMTPQEEGGKAGSAVEFTAQLMNNEHGAITDEAGDIFDSIYVIPTAGECAEGTPIDYP